MKKLRVLVFIMLAVFLSVFLGMIIVFASVETLNVEASFYKYQSKVNRSEFFCSFNAYIVAT